jgi:putative transposase
MANPFRRLMEVLAGARRSELRHQIVYLQAENKVLRARLPRALRTTPAERARLVELAKPLGRSIRELVTIVTPRTFARWVSGHRSAKSRAPSGRPGRPRTPAHVRELVLKIAGETDWGLTRIFGELSKLGVRVSRSTVKNILAEAGVPTGPVRGQGTWHQFLTMHAETLWACDFASRKVWTWKGRVDAFFLVFIHIASRKVWASPSVVRPTARWVAEQAWAFASAAIALGHPCKVLVRDRDSKFSGPFNTALKQLGISQQRTMHRAPNMNAHCERVILTAQAECLDRFVLMGTRHLDHVLGRYVEHYNAHRPHSALGCRSPTGSPLPAASRDGPVGAVLCETQLGGLLRHYRRVGA